MGNEDIGHLLSCLSHGEEFNGHLYTYTLLYEGTEKLKTTIKLKVDDGEIAVLPFIICLF